MEIKSCAIHFSLLLLKKSCIVKATYRSSMSHVKCTKHQPENPSVIAGLRLPALRVCLDGKVSSVSRLLGAMPFLLNKPPSATAPSAERDEHQFCYAKNTGCNPLTVRSWRKLQLYSLIGMIRSFTFISRWMRRRASTRRAPLSSSTRRPIASWLTG
jgi:hypothetical protein